MGRLLKISLWNADGLYGRSQEIITFLSIHNIDIMLISETHCTTKSFIRIPNYNIYNTRHPDGTAHGGTAVIIRKTIKHHNLPNYRLDHIQATSVVIEDWVGPITISALYSPPKHSINQDQYESYFKTLGNRFIAGGDYNAKHGQWGSRVANTKGRQLLKTINKNSYGYISTGEPTYWPTDRARQPDLMDFCVTKNIPQRYAIAESCLDLSSDHSPVIITLSTELVQIQKPTKLHSKNTNWNLFKNLISENLRQDIPLESEEQLNDAVEYLNSEIQQAAWNSTEDKVETDSIQTIPDNIKKLIIEKRKLRKIWQQTRHPENKKKLNWASRNLKTQLDKIKNDAIQNYISALTPTETTDYSLWKATRKLKAPTTHLAPIRKTNRDWAKSPQEKADTFAQHLATVFIPFPSENINEDEEIQHSLEQPFQMDMPIKKFKAKEIKVMIKKHINVRKSPGYDLITGKILHELPDKAIRVITMIFNAILRLEVFPMQWKMAQIIMIQKPGKPAEEVTSYRPISLLPILSKLFEKLFVIRLNNIINSNNIIPKYQFGFRSQHSTIEQVHRIVSVVRKDLEEKRYCSAAFLDISQAFDKVWHTGLLYKIKQLLPHTYYCILKSYLTDRMFQVKFDDAISKLQNIQSGVPQGSVLGPVLYLMYTADLPITPSLTIATFADDTALLASHNEPEQASKNLQSGVDKIQGWFKKWRIKPNETKSQHITFTLRRATCPEIKLNSTCIPQVENVKYLGIYLDRRLTWKKHIWTKRLQLNLKLNTLYWLLGQRSKLSLENKLLIYKAILKPIWTYGIQLWGTASKSNIDILERFQSKTLRIITNAPKYVTNDMLHTDLQLLTVKKEIKNFSEKYQSRLGVHPNSMAVDLLNSETYTKRLKRTNLLELPNRF